MSKTLFVRAGVSQSIAFVASPAAGNVTVLGFAFSVLSISFSPDRLSKRTIVKSCESDSASGIVCPYLSSSQLMEHQMPDIPTLVCILLLENKTNKQTNKNQCGRLI